jgi:hypothetical protein
MINKIITEIFPNLEKEKIIKEQQNVGVDEGKTRGLTEQQMKYL